MSDNEDLLGDDLGDQSLADYNLGNEEEEQLLADDYESGSSQNVPTSVGPNYVNNVEMIPNEFPGHSLEYNAPLPYQPLPEPECVVPNITVEVPNTPVPFPEHNVFPFEQPPVYGPEHAVVPPPIPAAVPVESSQIVPSEMAPPGAMPGRGRGRAPRQRDIPDSLDKVIVRGQRGRGAWRPHPYHRSYVRANFNQRSSFPPPQIRHSPPRIRPEIRPDRPEIIPDRPEIRPDPVPIVPPIPIRPKMSPERPMLQEVPFRNENPPFRPDTSPVRQENPPFGPEGVPFRPENIPIRPDNVPLRPDNVQFRPDPQFGPEIPFRPDHPPFGPNFRFQFRPEERNFRPNFNLYPRQFGPRPFGPPIREIAPNNASHMPQVTIRQPLPMGHNPGGREPEVRMLPLQLPPNLPPGGLAGKKVLINPHFKGTFQPPVEGAIKDIDDAAERFIAEQRNALARAATRKFRRSPQRYIENTTIEIENELAAAPGFPRDSDAELLRKQEEFIHANRAGLRRRMRTPSPDSPREPPRETLREPRESREPPRETRDRRRSLSPRRSPERRRTSPVRDEESEYRRRMREQENLRERVLRAKEFRRRKNAVAATQTARNNEDAARNRDRERQEKEREPPKPQKAEDKPEVKPDSTEKEKARERSPVRSAEVNSTSETLTPPREDLPRAADTPEPALTPPLPEKLDKSGEKPNEKPIEKSKDKSSDKLLDSDDDLDLILGDIDGILSDDEDSGRFKEKTKKQSPAPRPSDLRARLAPRHKQRIVFTDRPASPPRRAAASSSTPNNDNDTNNKTKQKTEVNTNKSRQRIIFDRKQTQQMDKTEADDDRKPQQAFANRRVVLQTKFASKKEKSVFARIEKTDPSKPNPGIFSRAVRTAIGSDKNRIVVKKDEPTVEYGSDSDDEMMIAMVSNLPEGITDTRLKTLAGADLQTLILDKEACTAKITFKTTGAAESFKKKFHNKMVSKSRLVVKLS
ncbi:titin isoform X2 [Amyelois transitella]|uniref:titin isoform X2 n=1 Tax=Amyelois transitella TaxID=680683 RepID=UPI00067C3EAD|nr:titin isoform X2 [Amyelois transitella]